MSMRVGVQGLQLGGGGLRAHSGSLRLRAPGSGQADIGDKVFAAGTPHPGPLPRSRKYMRQVGALGKAARYRPTHQLSHGTRGCGGG